MGVIIIPAIYLAFNNENYHISVKKFQNSNALCKSNNFLKDLDKSMITNGRNYDDVIEYLRNKTNVYGESNHIMKKDGTSKYHLYVFHDKSKIQFEFRQKAKKTQFKLFQVTAME